MKITTLTEIFNLVGSSVENIGYGYLKNQIVITIHCTQFEHMQDGSLVNFIFDGVVDVIATPATFNLQSNKIISIQCLPSINHFFSVIFTFESSEGPIKIDFKAKSFDAEFLNPYYDLKATLFLE